MTEPRCKSCDALLVWVLTPKGKRMPLDATSGRWLKVGEGSDSGVDRNTGGVLRGTFAPDVDCDLGTFPGDRAMLPGKGLHVRVFTSHFATCPAAGHFRRAR